MYLKKGLNSEYIKNPYEPKRKKSTENPIEKIGQKKKLYKRTYSKGQLTKEINGHLTKEDI